eukprot:gene4344-5436_t
MIDPIHIIQGEVYGLISHLKLNTRWASPGGYHQLYPESGILKSLKNLTNILHNVQDFKSLDTSIYLEPFLSVIRSDETSGPITGTALTNEESNNIHRAIREISESAAQCKFEETNAKSDEVVLMKILQVLVSCVKNPAGIYLSDDSVYRITLACYIMTDYNRSSELLKKTAEASIQEIIGIVFTRYNSYKLPPSPPPLPTHLIKNNNNNNSNSNSNSQENKINNNNNNNQDNNSESSLTFSPNNDLFFSNLPDDNSKFLKSQFEVFFNVLLGTIVENKSFFELQELALEGLRDYCKLPQTMVDLFINYDCEMHYSNVFESLCKFLYKNSFPITGSISSLHILSLENLLSIVQSIDDRSNRYNSNSNTNNNNNNNSNSHNNNHNNNNNVNNKEEEEEKEEDLDGNQTKTDFLNKKETKRQFLIAAEHFNRAPKDALEYIKNNKLYPTVSPENVAKFLLEAPKLNKLLVGEYIGKKGEFNGQVLQEYINRFDLKSTKCITSFRNFLESFRIPGDSAVINRIIDAYTNSLFEAKGKYEGFKTPDSLYVYLYSSLMLHTSVFNQSVMAKDRMTFQSFEKLLYKDYSAELIKEVYEETIKHEMVVEEEPTPGVINNSTWRNILKRTKYGDFVSADSNNFDKEIFRVVLNYVIPAISKVFEKVENELLCQRILDGFHLCAQVSSNYNINDAIDNLMNSLCNNTTLIDGETPPEHPIFIGDNKAQLATIATFEIAIKYAHNLSDSWKNIIAIICKLHKLDLLSNIFEVIDFPIETKKENKKDQEKSATQQKSFFGWFVAQEDDEEPIENEREQKAKICVENCHIDELFLETKTIPIESLEQLLQSLFIITNPKPGNSNLKNALFCFDLLDHIVLFNQHRLEAIWQKFYRHIELIIDGITGSGSTSISKQMTSLLQKITISLMYLLIRLLDNPVVAGTLESMIKLLLKVNPVLDSIAEKLSLALVQLVQQKITFIAANPSVWEPIIGIIVLLSGNPRASSRACEALSLMIKQKDALTQKTCQFCLEPLNCFINSKDIPAAVVFKAMELLYFIFTKIIDIMQIPTETIFSTGSATSVVVLASPLKNSSGGSDSLPASITANIARRKLDEKIGISWNTFWSPILKSFVMLCLDSKSDIRNNAMNYLQKTILSPSLGVLPPQRWFDCFVDIIFPLLTSLKEHSKESNFEDTRLRASALLSKVFLQNLTTIIKCEQFPTLWSEILSFLKIYMGLSELLSESVPESLKNMLLVMNNSGVFKPPTLVSTTNNNNNNEITNEISTKLWELTWSSINEFCPKITEDVLSRVDPNHNNNNNNSATSPSPTPSQPSTSSSPIPIINTTTTPTPTSLTPLTTNTPTMLPINNNNNNTPNLSTSPSSTSAVSNIHEIKNERIMHISTSPPPPTSSSQPSTSPSSHIPLIPITSPQTFIYPNPNHNQQQDQNKQ